MYAPKARVVATIGGTDHKATVLHKVNGVTAYAIRTSNGRRIMVAASQLRVKESDMKDPQCSCARHNDGSVTTFLCPVHAETDPCLTVSQVTGRRHKGTIKRGRCTSCGHQS